MQPASPAAAAAASTATARAGLATAMAGRIARKPQKATPPRLAGSHGTCAVYPLMGPLRGAPLARIVTVTQGATARRARGWRRAIIVSGVLALAIAPCACTASGRPGGHAVRSARATTTAPQQHRRSSSVQLVVEASGDLLIHSAIFERALVLGGGRRYDFAPMFTQIKPYIQGADLALCHVETPMTPAAPTGYPTFNTPPALATAIAQTGWRACSTAATHSLDQGQTGVDDTIRALDRAGVAHAGTYSSAAAQKTPLIMTVKGIRVAFLAYTELTNGIPSPHPWSVNRASAAQILSDAHRARADGAQVVIVNIHWGDQYIAGPAASSSPWPASSPAHRTSPRSSASTCTSSSPSASCTASWSSSARAT